MNEMRTPCRFDMFTRRKKTSAAPVKDAKEVFTYRGDKYSNEPDKMLKLLVGMVVNYRKQFAVMMIRDNSNGKVILKMLNGEPKINRLPDYSALIKNYPIPEYLSFEISD
jgi:hypothetical protein